MPMGRSEARATTFSSLEAQALLSAIDARRMELEEGGDSVGPELSALSRAEGKVLRATRQGSAPL